jgi:NAD(P)-dependent dehydrogenase (short-subunit alcohol dehydrogenase family)
MNSAATSALIHQHDAGDPMTQFPRPPFPIQHQPVPGSSAGMDPRPDHGEDSYHGSGRLKDKKALITGADSGIGRAVALAFAREGADVAVSYLCEDEDAKETERLVREAGRQCLLIRGDLGQAAHCRTLVEKTVEAFGRIDVIVNNAAHQMTFSSLDEISDEEWQRTFDTNISAMFYIVKAALPHIPAGGSIINTASINSDNPNPTLLPYATTKGAIQNFTGGLAQLLAEKDIRVNAVAPGPVWTPLIPSTMPAEKVSHFGEQVPMKRPAQPREVAPVYVLLASDEASYISGATVAVTGGKPII